MVDLVTSAWSQTSPPTILPFRPGGEEIPVRVAEFTREHSPSLVQQTEHCSFCGRHAAKVRYLLAGYVDQICNQCIGFCLEVMSSGAGEEWTERLRKYPKELA
jgi:hypothetical protein